jgi:ketol-acid reductoisomerase
MKSTATSPANAVFSWDALAGVMEAQYNLLRKNGHSPSEAFNETVEELTQSLIRLVAENGMDWMYANCSTTAQRGALDWAPDSGMPWRRCSKSVRECYHR